MYRAVVDRVLRVPFLKIGQMIALRQSWGVLFRAVIGSARKSARICNMKG